MINFFARFCKSLLTNDTNPSIFAVALCYTCLQGCRVIGSCGSDEKVKLAESLGYDGAFNYKTEKSWPEAIKRLAPNGIDCFFDNVSAFIFKLTRF